MEDNTSDKQPKKLASIRDGDFNGRVYRDYQIIKPIGQGKFSFVFKAKHIHTEEYIALKLLKIFDINDVKQRDNCIKEVKLMEKLEHKHITRYIESFIQDNEMFIAVEWAEHGDLKQYIKGTRERRESIPEIKVWQYIHQIASALKHMLECRVMHRDLKPANIFIDSQYDLKLGDLGLGRDFSSQTMEAFSRVGTPLYMSPEVLQGNGYDFQCDVWSLGCIGYELCALINPFKDETKKMSLYDLFQKIIKADYKPLSSSHYSPELLYIIDQMLIVNPEERVNISDVVTYCEQQIEKKHAQQRSTPTLRSNGSGSAGPSPEKPRRQFRIDPCLIMDDIIEKLRLLDYDKKFCKTRGHQPLSRTYFALDMEPIEDSEMKVKYMVELCFWLLSLGFEDSYKKEHRRKNGNYSSDQIKNPFENIRYEHFGSRQEAIHKVVKDIQKFKIHLPDDFEESQLLHGHGHVVCFIINDLTNRELIRRKFSFAQPNFKKMNTRDKADDDDSGEEDPVEGSTVFELSTESDIQKKMQLAQNAMALKKSKDITQNLGTKKNLFDKLNGEEPEDLVDLKQLSIPVLVDHDQPLRQESFDKSRNPSSDEHIQTTTASSYLHGTMGETYKSKLNLNSKFTIEKCVEDVIMPTVNAQQWREECKQVEKQLMIPIKRGGGDYSTTEMQDFFSRQEQVLQHLDVVKEFTHGKVPMMLDSIVESAKKELKRIKKKEDKLTAQNESQVAELKQINLVSSSIVKELKEKATSSQATLEELDQVDSELEQVSAQIQEKIEEESASDKRQLLKDKIMEMKAQIAQLSIREQLLRTQVEKYKEESVVENQEAVTDFTKSFKESLIVNKKISIPGQRADLGSTHELRLKGAFQVHATQNILRMPTVGSDLPPSNYMKKEEHKLKKDEQTKQIAFDIRGSNKDLLEVDERTEEPITEHISVDSQF